MDAVNLLPQEHRARKRSRLAATDDLSGRRTLQIGGIVAVVFAALIAGLYLHERSIVHSKQRHLAETQARLAAIQPQVESVKAQQAGIAGRLVTVQGIVNSRMNWDRALNDFARVIPTNSYLTSLQASAPVPTASAAVAPTSTTTTPTTPTTTPAPAASSTLSIAGVAPSTPGVALVLDKLSLLPWLSNVTLGSAARQSDGSNSFNISAGVLEEK